MNELIWMSAVDLATKMKQGELSAVEVLTAHIEQIETVNPELNAIITYLPEMALESARQADKRVTRGEDVGSIARSADRAQGSGADEGYTHNIGFIGVC